MVVIKRLQVLPVPGRTGRAEGGKGIVSDLADMMGISASQLRQDLNHFGEFGQQGMDTGLKDYTRRSGVLLVRTGI